MLNQLTFEIQNKLEKEEGDLDLLKERVERSNHITKSMIGILDSFEQRLSRLEETILPVYNETGNLQKRQQNIEKTLMALDTVINYYTVSQEVESIIRTGPSTNTDGLTQLDPFLKAMEKLQIAQEYFERHNPQSVELENVTTLFNDGGLALSREFKNLLRKYSKPVPPSVLLELVGNDEDTSNEGTLPSLHHFPQSVSDELIRIADWLITHNRDEYMNVYAKVRETVLESSMKQLRDHQKNSSGGSFQNAQGIISSPLVKPKFQSGRKVSKRLQHALEKKANKMFLKASQTLEHSTGLTLGNRRPTLLLEPREDFVEEQEMENYLVTVLALQKLIQSERNLMMGIIPLQHQSKIFEMIIKSSMDGIVQEGDNIATRAKKCINRHDFVAVLIVFPILKQLLNMKPEFDKTVQGCDRNVKTKFMTILNTLHSTGAKALEDFIESVRNDSNSQLPKDGTVHELTSNVLVFLEQLTEYTDTVAEVLSRDPAYVNAFNKVNTQEDKNKVYLGIYIKKVLAQLNATLMNKSDVYSDVHLRAIFRLNNIHHMLKSLQRSELLDLVKLSEPNCEANYYEMIEEYKKKYMDSWARVLSYIWSTEEMPQSQYGKVKDKDRYGIKEKFSGFNKDIEEISRIQRGYSIPDVELRESLKRDNKELILPKYNAFYERYSSMNFSKNPEKYIKYNPAQVSALIDRFFDVAA
ncbi:UNVERIFIED_CONTAM: hypothetical protein PYX00_000199 [Menopon gallinae]|uniref:Exocyst complex component 7 n=1 Tax=Menopon gallinae TaxID=328185 RepID=A0AAW2I9E1_9NEOP